MKQEVSDVLDMKRLASFGDATSEDMPIFDWLLRAEAKQILKWLPK